MQPVRKNFQENDAARKHTQGKRKVPELFVVGTDPGTLVLPQKIRVLIEKTPLKVLHFAPEYGLKKVLHKLKNLSYTNVDLIPDLADEIADITPYPI